MKKLLLLLVFLGGVAFAGVVVPTTSLPTNAQNFIATNFKGANAVYVKMGYDKYETMLSNGAKIKFFPTGEWKKVKNYMGVNPSFLPAPLASAISKNFPSVQIIEVDKKWSGYEVKLANRVKAYFDANGNLMGQKYKKVKF